MTRISPAGRRPAGDLLVQQGHTDATEHAYQAAINVGHKYRSPTPQVALAQLLTDRGDLEQAQALLEAAIASGDARTVHVAQASLGTLKTGQPHHQATSSRLETYETLGDPTSAYEPNRHPSQHEGANAGLSRYAGRPVLRGQLHHRRQA